MFKRILLFLALIIGTVITTYYTSGLIAGLYYLAILFAYFRSTDEAMWLAFFLVTADNFIGFFGPYHCTLGILPGLPAIEIGQMYIILSIIKAINKGRAFLPYYRDMLVVLLVYLIFLIAQGVAIGLDLQFNILFRIVKECLPLFLLYSLPRLMDKDEDYERFFNYLFPIIFTAFLSQVFTITMDLTPSEYLGGTKPDKFAPKVSDGRTYRGIFSSASLLITMLGALYLLARKDRKTNTLYLYTVIAANFLSVFLSATRGWVLSFGFMIFLFMIFVLKFDLRKFFILGLTSILLFMGLRTMPIVGTQINNAVKRLSTISALADGDPTAGGTLIRISERSPRVMRKFYESPLTGWGFSNTFMKYSDLHVGNQNILMHSGVVGFFLMFLFFFYFNWKQFIASVSLPEQHALKSAPLALIIFFLGWFVIHSSSAQYFGYYLAPTDGILVGSFISLGGKLYDTISS